MSYLCCCLLYLHYDAGTEGSAWEIKAVPSQNSSWGAAAADEKMVANTGIVGSWGTSRGDRVAAMMLGTKLELHQRMRLGDGVMQVER